MKFSCEKNLLVSAISVASRTVAMKSAIPALEGIYIRAGVKVMLSGYNLETGITVASMPRSERPARPSSRRGCSSTSCGNCRTIPSRSA